MNWEDKCYKICSHDEPCELECGPINGCRRPRSARTQSLRDAKFGIFKAIEHLFYRTLCTRPDGGKLSFWWYNFSGKISSYFHIKTCMSCQEKVDYQKYAKEKP